jgi:hypothetical protein
MSSSLYYMILLAPSIIPILYGVIGRIPQVWIFHPIDTIPTFERGLLVSFGVVWIVAWPLAIYPAISSHPPTPPSPSPTVSTPIPTSAPPSEPPRVIAKFNNSGTQNTQPFTVPSGWHLSWWYWQCADGTGNFTVEQHNTDGRKDPSGITINEHGTGRGPVATFAYGDAGSHYFSVKSECKWSLAVVVGGP